MSLRRNTVFGTLGFVVPTLVVFLAYPVVLRHLGAGDMGVYILATTLSGSFAFLELGLTTISTKLVAEAAGRGDAAGAADAVATSTAFYLVLGACGLVAIWVLAPPLARWSRASDPAVAATVFRIAAATLLASYLHNVALSVVKGLQRFDLASAQVTVLSLLVWGGALAVVVLPGGGVVRVAEATLVANLLVVALSGGMAAVLCRGRGIGLARGRPRLGILRSMFRLGVFMSLNGLANVLFNQLQSFVMARLLTPVAVAVYGTAVQVSSKVNALSSASFEMMLPLSAELSEPGAAQYRARVHTLRSVYLKALALSFALSVAALSHRGPGGHGASHPLRGRGRERRHPGGRPPGERHRATPGEHRLHGHRGGHALRHPAPALAGRAHRRALRPRHLAGVPPERPPLPRLLRGGGLAALAGEHAGRAGRRVRSGGGTARGQRRGGGAAAARRSGPGRAASRRLPGRGS